MSTFVDRTELQDSIFVFAKSDTSRRELTFFSGAVMPTKVFINTFLVIVICVGSITSWMLVC